MSFPLAIYSEANSQELLGGIKPKMSQPRPPFKAEHMGSLLRPQNLLDAREKVRDQGVSLEEAGLPEIEKKAVADVVKLQQDLGFRAVTSGEFNHTRFWGLM